MSKSVFSDPMRIRNIFQLAGSLLCIYVVLFFLTTPSNVQGPGSKAGNGRCLVSDGEWIPDPGRRPLYTDHTCEFIQPAQNCIKNGRPESGYLHWTWKPRNCQLPEFDPALFLHLVRGMKLVFIGDSLARNHFQSLLCALSQVEKPREVYRQGLKDVKMLFPSHEFLLAIFWSPLLVRHEVSTSEKSFRVHVDSPDPVWASELGDYNFAIVSAGQWFFHPSVYYMNNETVGRNEFLTNSSLPDLRFTFGLEMAFRSMLRYMVDAFSGLVILRTASVSHFEHGQWSTGGVCNKTRPVEDQGRELSWGPMEMRRLQLQAASSALAGDTRGGRVKIMDVTRSMFLRPDGHPGRYRGEEYGGSNTTVTVHDCLHWCLPGPIDMWNQILLRILQDDHQS